MSGKFFVGIILVSALIVGGAIYYLQIYGYYREIPASSPAAEIRLTTLAGVAEPVTASDFRGIDADSSPIRYRACFRVEQSAAMLAGTYQAYDGAEPLVTPGWFTCFDAGVIDAALEEGRATAYMGEENIYWGIDRIVAIMDDGRAFAWNQINKCGAEVFDGQPAPAGCPPQPEK